MKKLFLTGLFMSLLFSVFGQSKLYLRGDSVYIQRDGGNGELILLNGSRNVTGGVLTNLGNGRTGFVLPSPGGLAGGNLGSGFRIYSPVNSGNYTLFNGFGINWDSTSNANGLTPKVDSLYLTTRDRNRQQTDSLVALINARNLQVVTNAGNKTTNALVVQGSTNGSSLAGTGNDFSAIVQYNSILSQMEFESRGQIAGTAAQRYTNFSGRSNRWTFRNFDDDGNAFIVINEPHSNITDSTGQDLFRLQYLPPWAVGLGASYNANMVVAYADGSIYTKRIRHATAASVDTFVVREGGHFKYLTKAEMTSLFSGGGGGTGGGVNIYNSDSALTGPRRVRGMGYPLVFDSIGSFRVRQFTATDSTIFEINQGLDHFTVNSDTSSNLSVDILGGVRLYMAKVSTSRLSGFKATLDSSYVLGLSKSNDTTAYKRLVINPVTGALAYSNLLYPESGGTALTTVAFGSTPNSNGGGISGATLTLQPANGSNPGGISLSAQSMGAGTKTFTTSDGTGQAYFVDSRGGGETAAMLAGAAGSIFAYTSTGFFGISGPNSTGGFTGGNDLFLLYPANSSNAHFGNLAYTQTDIGAQVNILPSSTSKVGQIIKLAGSATGDAFQVLNSSSAVLARFNEVGYLGIGVDPLDPLDVTGNVRLRSLTSTTALDSVMSVDAGIVKYVDLSTVVRMNYASVGSTGTPTPAIPASTQINYYLLSGLATNATFGAPTGSPSFGYKLYFRINDNGTARTLTWNAIYRESTSFALPLTTTGDAGDYIYLEFQWNELDSKWDAVGYTPFVLGWQIYGFLFVLVFAAGATYVENRLKKAA